MRQVYTYLESNGYLKKKDFEGAVDDYIASCVARGIEPSKPYSGTFNVRVSPEIHSAIANLAQKAGITIKCLRPSSLGKRSGIGILIMKQSAHG